MKQRMWCCVVLGVLGGAWVGSVPPALAICPPNLPGVPLPGGFWSGPISFPLPAIEAVVLKTGQVLCCSFNQCFLFDPSSQTVSATFFVTIEDEELFCSGFCQLPDGKIIFTGGGNEEHNAHFTTIYNPDVYNSPQDPCPGPPEEDCWIPAQDNPANRFYPTLTTLWDGRILATGAYWNFFDADHSADTPAIFDPVTGQWTSLCDATFCTDALNCSEYDEEVYPDPNICPDAGPIVYNFHIDWYPFMFQVSDGPVLYVGSGFDLLYGPAPDPPRTRTLDPFLEVWTDVLPDPDPILGGSAVMYQSDLILKSGGNIPATAQLPCPTLPANTPSQKVTSDAYKFNAKNPANGWTPTGQCMNNARRHHYLVGLADGKVLAVGGEYGDTNSPTFVRDPEIYDPAGDTWAVMLPHAGDRGEHSTAVLLPDGRVLLAGSPAVYAEIFWPPYLFAPGGGCVVRPKIDGVQGPQQPDVIQHGKGFIVLTNDAPNITTVRLIRLGAATHGFDFDQRSMTLKFTKSTSSLKIVAPNAYSAPPGYYMVFILDDGVPSIARIVKLEPAGWTGP